MRLPFLGVLRRASRSHRAPRCTYMSPMDGVVGRPLGGGFQVESRGPLLVTAIAGFIVGIGALMLVFASVTSRSES